MLSSVPVLRGINIGWTLLELLRVILVGGTAARLWSSLSSLLRSNIRFLLSSESERINWSASLAGLDS